MQIHNNPTGPLKPQVAVRPSKPPAENNKPSVLPEKAEGKSARPSIDEPDQSGEMPSWMTQLAEAEEINILPPKPARGWPRKDLPSPPNNDRKPLPPGTIGGRPQPRPPVAGPDPLPGPRPPFEKPRVGPPDTPVIAPKPVPVPRPPIETPKAPVGGPEPVRGASPTFEKPRIEPPGAPVIGTKPVTVPRPPIEPPKTAPIDRPLPAKEAPLSFLNGTGASTDLGTTPPPPTDANQTPMAEFDESSLQPTENQETVDSVETDSQNTGNLDNLSEGKMESINYEEGPAYNGTNMGSEMDSINYQEEPKYNANYKGPDMDSVSYQSDPKYNGTYKGPDMDSVSYQSDPKYNGTYKGPEMDSVSTQSDPKYNGTDKGPEMNSIGYQEDPRYNGGIGSATPITVPAPGKYDDNDSLGFIEGKEFQSWGDPHEVTGDGLKFDNQKVGDFIKVQSKRGDFVMQSRQAHMPNNPNVTFNIACGLRLGRDVVSYDAKTDKIMVNGKELKIEVDKEVVLVGGGKIRRLDDNTIEFISREKDRVQVTRKTDQASPYIDIEGELSNARKAGEVRGSLGTFDSDESYLNDLVGRDGQSYDDDVDKFLEDWRVKDKGDEKLIP